MSPLTAIQAVRAFGDSLMYFPNRLFPIFGALGWQDTWMPGLLLLTVTVLMVGVAGAMWWLARADRARIAATQKGGDDRPGSSEVASERMPGHASRTTAARAALTLILLASTAFLIYAWRVQRPSGLMNVDDSDYSTLALRYWRHLGRCTMSQPARRSPMVVAFVLLPYDPCPSWSS